MKPILIYAMARTRSTAVLASCKRTQRLCEPFRRDNSEFANVPWDQKIQMMNDPKSATKIFGWHLAAFPPARKWYEDALLTHEVFVLTRDLREICLSNCLADVYGWNKSKEKQNPFLRVQEVSFIYLAYNIDQFLRFYPIGKKVITFDSLPEEYFDKALNTSVQNQNLHSRLNEIENLDEVNKNIDRIMGLYGPEWNEKVGS